MVPPHLPSSFFGLCSLYFSTLEKILPFLSFLTRRCTAPPASVKSLVPTPMLVKVLSTPSPSLLSPPLPRPCLYYMCVCVCGVCACIYNMYIFQKRRKNLFSLSCVGMLLWLCVDASLALRRCFFGFMGRIHTHEDADHTITYGSADRLTSSHFPSLMTLKRYIYICSFIFLFAVASKRRLAQKKNRWFDLIFGLSVDETFHPPTLLVLS